MHGALALGVAVAAVAASAPALGREPAATAGAPKSAAVVLGNAVVAADHLIASQAGADMLAKGGNAVDAAVAASFALSVVRPFSCGIGGGGFMVISLPQRDGVRAEAVTVALNYRETCPGAIKPDTYDGPGASLDPEASTRGVWAVATPGTVAGLLYALDNWGTLDRATVLAPAIAAAEQGFAADSAYVGAARVVSHRLTNTPRLAERFAPLSEQFLGKGTVAVGDIIKLPDQAKALRSIAELGKAAMYDAKSGPIAKAIIAAMTNLGGPLTADDLANYTVKVDKPLQAVRFGRTLLTMPPPSSGGVALIQTTGLMEMLGAEAQRDRGPGEPATYLGAWRADANGRNGGPYLYKFIETLKIAFADRAIYMADPAFIDVPIAKLTSDAYLKNRRPLIKLNRTQHSAVYTIDDEGNQRAEQPDQLPPDGGTSHISVVDADGGAVACTETINLEFGSWVVVPGFGFCLNNQMDDFTTSSKANAFGLTQSDSNRPQAGKRPLSSMTPTIILGPEAPAKSSDQPAAKPTPLSLRVEAVIGASGGPRIISATAQCVLDYLIFGRSAGDAVSAPRVHHQWMPNILNLETTLVTSHQGLPMFTWMSKLGHRLEPSTSGAAVQMITRQSDGQYQAASDPRKGGTPAAVPSTPPK